MYTSYFGLTEKPFTITPDPRYLFLSTRHGEGLAHLIYGVTESDGFIQLTGEVGTGKTTLIRSLLQQLPDNTDVALVLNPQLSVTEFLTVICDELNIPGIENDLSQKQLIDRLNDHLLKAHAEGRRTILVVDEAQNLAADVLEEVRLLTNLETARQKLLQIILIGQPELRALLSRNDLRQLAQRVTARYHLEPLSREEAYRYIDHRLEIAGAVSEIFTPVAKREIFKISNGVPRIMNVICDRAMLGAYVREQQIVDQKLVREAASEISGRANRSPVDRFLLPALGVLGAVMIGTGFWFFSQETEAVNVPSAAASITPQTAAEADPAEVAATREKLLAYATPADSSTGSVNSLEALLRKNQNATGTDTAFATLFSVWDITFTPRTDRACEQAETQNLKCLFLRGSWNVVRQLNRPVILTLTDRSGEAHQVVLTRMTDTTADISIGPHVHTLALDDISEYWFGESLLLWKPPNGQAKSYQRGSRDPGVLWLRQSLAAILGVTVTDADSELFDESLERQVKDYQRNRRLKVDGLVGQQTQIIINSDLGLDGIPHLLGEQS